MVTSVTLERYVEGWNDHDPGAVMAAFAPGETVVAPPFDGPWTGREIGEWVAETVSGFPAVRFEEQDTVALEGVDIFSISEEGIESIEIYFDQSSMAERLGLTFRAIVGQLPKLETGAIRNAL